MPNTYACKGVSNPNVPIFLPRVCTLVLFIMCINHNYNPKYMLVINPRHTCVARVAVVV